MNGLIDFIVFNAVFNIISLKLKCPAQLSVLSRSSFTRINNFLSKPLAAFRYDHRRNNEQGECGMNPAAMTVINPLPDNKF